MQKISDEKMLTVPQFVYWSDSLKDILLFSSNGCFLWDEVGL